MFSVISYAFSKVTLEVGEDELEEKEEASLLEVRPPKAPIQKNQAVKIRPGPNILSSINRSHANEDSWKGRLYRNCRRKHRRRIVKASRLEMSVRAALKEQTLCAMLKQVRLLLGVAPPVFHPKRPKMVKWMSEKRFLWNKSNKNDGWTSRSVRGLSTQSGTGKEDGESCATSSELAIIPQNVQLQNGLSHGDGSQRNVFEFLLSCLTPSSYENSGTGVKYKTLQDTYDQIS